MRRFLLIVLLLVVVAAAAWTLLRWNSEVLLTKDPWRAIPDRAAVVIEVPDAWTTWDRFTHTSQLWGAFEGIRPVAAMGRLMARTVERAENDAALREALSGVSMLISVTRTGGDVVDVLFTCVPRSKDGVPTQAFGELLKADEATMAALAKGGVVQLRPDTALPELSLAVVDGLWLLASSPAMMDEAMLQLKSGKSIAQDTLLAEARATLGAGSDAHVLIHMDRTKALLNSWWRPEALESHDLPSGWLALDLRARPDAFLLSGLLLPSEGHKALTVVEQQGVGRNDLSRWLPAEVNAWDVAQISDPERAIRTIGVANDTDIGSLAPSLFSWVHGSVGRARGQVPEGSTPPLWAYFSTEDPEGAVAELNKPCPEGPGCDTSSYRGVRLTRLPTSYGLERLLGKGYADLVQPYWCLLGDVIVFGPDLGAMRTVVDARLDGRTLAEDARTTAWTQRISSSAGRTMRWDVARAWNSITRGMKPEALAAYSAQIELMQQLGGLSIQLTPAQHGRIHVAIGLQHAPLEERATGVLWSTPLAAAVQRKPDIVRNHTNDTREVFVQDVEHRIHLLSTTGKVLWSRELDGPIMGEVQQVDRFRNGKLQLLLNTAGRLYLIDRNGRDVGGFPVSLTERATAPLAVFDYDGQRDYRILLPTTDGRIQNYGLEGSPIKGWSAPRLGSPANTAVHHLRIKNKDYLLVVDGNGRVLLLDRRGEEREKSDLTLDAGARVLHIAPGLDLMSTRITWADTSRSLVQGRLDGQRSTLASGGGGQYFLGDLADDGEFDLVRINFDSLVVTHAGKSVLVRSFGTPLQPVLDTYALGTGMTYSVIQPEREQISMIDRAGTEWEGMPVRGATRFSIADLNLDGGLELVTVTAEGRVVAYRLPGATSER